jgi:hypothetical protein
MKDLLVNPTRDRIRFLQDRLVEIAAWSEGADPSVREHLLAPYRELLNELYEEDLPLAKLADESDLLLHVSGSAASGEAPRVTLLTRLMTLTRDEVTRLAKQFAGVGSVRVPNALDMSFVGLAGGSLFVGFSAMNTSAEGDATREAVEAIGDASNLVSQGATLDQLAEALPDPAARDIAITAVRHLSPSGQIGVTEIEILGRHVKQPVSLTTETRRNARVALSKPAQTRDRVQLLGTIREVDLDASRFELRSVDGATGDVRCAHELDESEVKALIDRRVRVLGRPELGTKGTIRLLWVDEIELIN